MVLLHRVEVLGCNETEGWKEKLENDFFLQNLVGLFFGMFEIPLIT